MRSGKRGSTRWQSSRPYRRRITLDAEKPVQGRLLDPQGRLLTVGVRVAVVRVGCVFCMDASHPGRGKPASPLAPARRSRMRMAGMLDRWPRPQRTYSFSD